MSARVGVVVDVAGLRLRADLLRVDMVAGYLAVWQWDCDDHRWEWAANGGWSHLGARLDAESTLGRGPADTEECLQAIDRALRDALRRAA